MGSATASPARPLRQLKERSNRPDETNPGKLQNRGLNAADIMAKFEQIQLESSHHNAPIPNNLPKMAMRHHHNELAKQMPPSWAPQTKYGYRLPKGWKKRNVGMDGDVQWEYYCSDPVTLPPGWRSDIDSESGKTYYVDNNTKTTTWEKPEAVRSQIPDGIVFLPPAKWVMHPASNLTGHHARVRIHCAEFKYRASSNAKDRTGIILPTSREGRDKCWAPWFSVNDEPKEIALQVFIRTSLTINDFEGMKRQLCDLRGIAYTPYI